MIRSADLRPGDVLQHHLGERYELIERAGDSWLVNRANPPRYAGAFALPDADIDRSGPDRLWWLDDETEAR